MKKDKLKEEIMKFDTNRGYADGVLISIRKDDLFKLIDQLDEPELPVIPQFVASAIEKTKENRKNITILNIFNEVTVSGFYTENVDDWISTNSDLFCQAWFSKEGYTIEKEKMYHVLDKEGNVLLKNKESGYIARIFSAIKPSMFPEWQEESLKLTEQEIKDYDERYWAFAVEVPNV